MAEYIERESLYEKAYWHGEHPNVSNPFPDGVDAIDIEDVDAIPAADVVPVRHGRWVDRIVDENEVIQPWMKRYYCSECLEGGNQSWFKFCPNCGTKMDGCADHEP